MHLPNLRQWIRAETPHDDAEDGLVIPYEKQEFELLYNDGDTLEGDNTLGFRSERCAWIDTRGSGIKI